MNDPNKPKRDKAPPAPNPPDDEPSPSAGRLPGLGLPGGRLTHSEP